MLEGNSAPVITLVWIFVCITIFFYLLKSNKLLPGNIAAMLFVALVVRVIPALLLPSGAGGYEMGVFQEAADIFRRGENIYLVPVAHPYLPLLIYWFALADWLAENVGLFFVFWLKSVIILADLLIVLVIFYGLSTFSTARVAQKRSWLYVFNPITVLVAAYQGQFDSVPLLLILLAWFWYRKSHFSDRGVFGTAGFIGTAILSKTWPFILAPITFLRLKSWRQRIIFAIAVLLPLLIGILLFEQLFPGGWRPMLRRAMRAGPISGWWGYSSLISAWMFFTGSGEALFAWVAMFGKYLGYFAGLIAILLTRKRPLLDSLLVTILIMQTAVPNLGLQSLSWIVPIAIIIGRDNALGWYIIGALIHMIISYWGIHITNWLYLWFVPPTANVIVQLSSLSVWSVMILWWIQELGGKTSMLPIFFQNGDLNT